MKVIVLSGIHGNETAGIRISHDLSKNNYEELNRLVSKQLGRKITDKEVEFLNVSKYTVHALQRRFMRECPLWKLLNLYENYADQIPKKYRELLHEYLDLWKNTNIRNERDFNELKGKCLALARRVYCSLYNKKEKIDFIFPKILNDFVKYTNPEDVLDKYDSIAPLKAKLQPVDIVIDLHSAPEGSRPFIINLRLASQMTLEEKKEFDKIIRKYMKYKGSKPPILTEKALALLSKHKIPIPPNYWDLPQNNSRYIRVGVEICYPYIKKGSSDIYKRFSSYFVKPREGFDEMAELYKRFSSYPNVCFLELLDVVFSSAVYGLYESQPLFYDMFRETFGRGDFTNPAFYRTLEFKQAKRFVANIILQALCSEYYKRNSRIGSN